MRVAVVHGYYLYDSGSGTHVRELTRELVRQGHDVTLVCQERRPEACDFIDSTYVLDETNTRLTPTGRPRRPDYAGRCRLVRPHLGGRLLVYVQGPFPGFEHEQVRAFQDAPTEWIEGYVGANLRALRTTFSRWRPDVVLANHAVMQPHVVKHALATTGPAVAGDPPPDVPTTTARPSPTPYTVTLHGSELNFSIKRDPRLVPYAVDGLDTAAAVVTITEANAREFGSWAQQQGLDIADKTSVVTPGIDGRTFAPAASRPAAIAALRHDVGLPAGFELGPADDILAFAGRLMWTKGIQHAVAALPLIIARRPGARLLVAGQGPARRPLERLAACLGRGDSAGAHELALAEEELRTPPEFGPVIIGALEGAGAWSGASRVAFLGHLAPDALARVFAAADLSLAPSVFPEALGLVTMEALSAGALPVAAYHSGLASVIDVVSDTLDDPAFRAAAAGRSLTGEVARMVVDILERYPTTDPAFRTRLHDLSGMHFPSWETVARRYLELAGTEQDHPPGA